MLDIWMSGLARAGGVESPLRRVEPAPAGAAGREQRGWWRAARWLAAGRRRLRRGQAVPCGAGNALGHC